jgi:hypothetical protein
MAFLAQQFLKKGDDSTTNGILVPCIGLHGQPRKNEYAVLIRFATVD